MSHTNVYVPHFQSTDRRLLNENRELQERLKVVIQERDHVANEMENIMDAVEEWGFVDLKSEETGKSIRLVKQEVES